jgi:hypothetical protein
MTRCLSLVMAAYISLSLVYLGVTKIEVQKVTWFWAGMCGDLCEETK